ncbi:MAG: hypothetical protein Q9215_003679 [Flavoplaca cf. flavocitrina]
MKTLVPRPCHQLQAVLGSAVFFPEQVAYNLSISTYWSQQERSLTYSCIVSPQNTQDVSKVVVVLSQYQAAAKSTIAGCKFAIRGAGHTPWAGSANIVGDVTIDMTSIGAVILNRAKTAISVGVRGLVTGGGVSYFAPRYVFVCDQVVNYEIVLANGTAVNANAENNSDLWFALQDGSNNFGDGTRM